MDPSALRKYVLKALEGGAVGDLANIRNLTAGAAKEPLSVIEGVLQDLEDDGLALFAGGVWRSAKLAALAGEGESPGTQMRSLVYIPSVDPTTYLHLSYKSAAGWFRLRRYRDGSRAEIVPVPEAENDVNALRRLHRVEDEREWSERDARPIEDFDFWGHEITRLNKRLKRS